VSLQDLFIPEVLKEFWALLPSSLQDEKSYLCTQYHRWNGGLLSLGPYRDKISNPARSFSFDSRLRWSWFGWLSFLVWPSSRVCRFHVQLWRSCGISRVEDAATPLGL